MQDKIYIKSGTGLQEVDVLRQDHEDYFVKYCGVEISVDKQTMTSAFTGGRKWTTKLPNHNYRLVSALQEMLAKAESNYESEEGAQRNAVVYNRLKDAGLV